MTFDPKSLLADPPMTVDGLAATLAKIKALGLGGAKVTLPDGQSINAVDLVAAGAVPAHFVFRSGNAENIPVSRELLNALELMLDEFVGGDLTGWDKGSAVDSAISAIQKAKSVIGNSPSSR